MLNQIVKMKYNRLSTKLTNASQTTINGKLEAVSFPLVGLGNIRPK